MRSYLMDEIAEEGPQSHTSGRSSGEEGTSFKMAGKASRSW